MAFTFIALCLLLSSSIVILLSPDHQVAAQDLENGLRLYYAFSNGNGIAVDASGNGRDGTNNGATVVLGFYRKIAFEIGNFRIEIKTKK